MKTGKETTSFKGHSGWVHGVQYSPDGRTIVSGSSDNGVRVWDVMKGKEITSLNGHSGPVYGVKYSPDGHTIASCSNDRTIILWG